MDTKERITFRLPKETLVLLERYSADHGFGSVHEALLSIIDEKLSQAYSESDKEKILSNHSVRPVLDLKSLSPGEDDPMAILEDVIIKGLESDRKSPDA